MRRGLLAFAAVGVALALLSWGAAALDRRGGVERAAVVPRVVWGRDAPAAGVPRATAPPNAFATVHCAVAPGTTGELLALGQGGDLRSARIDGDAVSLHLPEGEWMLGWSTGKGDRSLGTVQLAAGDIHTCALSAEGWTVRGEVRNLDGHGLPDVRVSGCGGYAVTGGDGAFSFVAPSGGCDVVAWWADGLLRRRSDPVRFEVTDASPLLLEVDDTPIGGMGIGIAHGEGGVRVRMVHAGTPAAEAGLRTGDVVVEVDGESVADAGLDDFVALGTGRPGSRVHLRVRRGGDEFDLSFHRARIAEEAPTVDAAVRERLEQEIRVSATDTGE